MKKKENIPRGKNILLAWYLKRFKNYEGIISKSASIISKYARELAKMEAAKNNISNKKAEKEAKISELEEKKEKNLKKNWRITMILLCAFVLAMIVLLCFHMLDGSVPFIFSILTCLNTGIYNHKDSKLNRELNKLIDEKGIYEDQELNLNNEISKLRTQIEKLEQINLITKEKLDIVVNSINQIEEQISLEEQQPVEQEHECLQVPQVAAPNQFSLYTSQDNNSQQVIASRQVFDNKTNKNTEGKLILW